FAAFDLAEFDLLPFRNGNAFDRLLLALADDDDVDLLVLLQIADHLDGVARLTRERFAVEGQKDVFRLDAGLLGGRVLDDLRDNDALALGQIELLDDYLVRLLDGDAESAFTRLARTLNGEG